MRRLAALFLLLVLVAAGAGYALLGGGPQPPRIESVTADPLIGLPGEVAVFATLTGRETPDRLVSVRSPVASGALIASPDAARGAPVPALDTVSLSYDGAHLRLRGVEGGVSAGRLIPLTLVFERAGEVAVQARVGSPRLLGSAESVGLAGLGGLCRVGEGEPAPKVALSAEPDGAGGWRILIDAQEFVFRQDLADGPHVPGTGHGHLYVGGVKVGRLYAPEARIGALPPGRHLVRATLNTNDHRAYVVEDTPVSATVEIVVESAEGS